MTVPNGYVKFNADTGSDTLASGLGPSTPLNGSAASTTASSAVVTGIDTTAVTAGDLLWVQSSSGRQFSIIASVDSATQVTCDDTFDNTESSRTWAIGGKRATLDDASSRRLTSGDMGQTWIELETDQTITSGLGAVGGHTRIKSSGSTKKTITISGAGEYMLLGGIFYLRDIKMRALDNNVFADAAGTATTFLRTNGCVIGDPDYPFSALVSSNWSVNFDLYETLIQEINPSGDIAPAGTLLDARLTLDNCVMKNCGRFHVWGPGGGLYGFRNSIFIGTGADFHYANYGIIEVHNCIFYNYDDVFVGGAWRFEIYNCIFHTVNNIAKDIYGRPELDVGVRIYNSFGYNVTSNIITSKDVISYTTLTEDPFVDVPNDDFNINNTTGGGAVIKAVSHQL